MQLVKAVPKRAPATRKWRVFFAEISEAEGHVRAQCPTADVRPPQVRSADSKPLHLPELVQKVQHQPAVHLVDVLHIQSFL